jgi:hypothetical protein
MQEPLILISLILGIGGGLVLLIISVRKVYDEEATETGQGWFRPVGITKFFLLSTVSLGIYSLYWFWRCWRRYRITEEPDISPFLRTFFSIFWIIALFRAANEKSDTKWPVWIAVVSTIAIIITSIMVQLGYREDAPFWQTEPIAALTILGYVPLVMQINRINAPELVAQCARFSRLDLYALACGVPFWLTLLITP